jgi:hypothetical protein
MLTWPYVNEERDDKSFMGVERVSWGWNSSALFPKYKCVGNWDMKLALRLALVPWAGEVILLQLPRTTIPATLSSHAPPYSWSYTREIRWLQTATNELRFFVSLYMGFVFLMSRTLCKSSSVFNAAACPSFRCWLHNLHIAFSSPSIHSFELNLVY